MKTKYFFKLFMMLVSLSSFSQNTNAFFDLNFDSQIDIRATSSGDFKNISVELSNFGNSTTKIYFPVGGMFVNLDSAEQNLVVLFNDVIEVKPDIKEKIIISTACANPKRKPPKNGRTTWVFDYDPKIGDLIQYYHDNRGMVELLTGSEHHNSFDKRHNFLQMCVWVYFDADKKQITDFATKYNLNPK